MTNTIEAYHAIDELAAAVGSPRECEACGRTFVCGASLKGCWCSQIKLCAEVKVQMCERYRDCLCSECLTRLAVEDAPPKTAP